MMKANFASASLLLFFCITAAQADETVTFGTGANQFNMVFVPIGNPGNLPDDDFLYPEGQVTGPGAVAYEYCMGKFEVSRDMIEKANVLGGLGIELPNMLNWALRGNGADDPATRVSWNMAARFVNWLNTSQGYSPAYKFTKQPGEAGYDANENVLLWTANDPGYNPSNGYRNNLARYVIPSMWEWHKAVYYDPSANGGAGGYWAYPNGSNSPPVSVQAGTSPNTAVYGLPNVQTQFGEKYAGPSSVYLAGGLSPYGVMGMGGNVWEFEESDMWASWNPGLNTVRGGNWLWSALGMKSTYRDQAFGRSNAQESVGFRVASVPEPSTVMLGALGVLVVLRRIRRTG